MSRHQQYTVVAGARSVSINKNYDKKRGYRQCALCKASMSDETGA